MPGVCEVLGCTNHSMMARNKPSFHRFPSDLARRMLWIQALQKPNRYGVEWAPKSHSRVCGRHFIAGKPSQDPAHADYVPSLFLTAEPRVQREEFTDLCNTAKKQRLTSAGSNTDDLYLACEALLSLSGSYNVAINRETATFARNSGADDTLADPETLLRFSSSIPALVFSSSSTSTVQSHSIIHLPPP